MKHLLFIIYFIGAVTMTNCSEQSDVASLTNSPIVVEGWIGSGDFPVVMLSLPFSVSSNYRKADNLKDYVLRWAKVTVSCDDDSVVLIGKYDKSYFPPYIYTTGRLRGQTGKAYQLKVEYDGKIAYASTYIPDTPAECTFRVEKCQDSDSLFLIMAHIANSTETPAYYQLFTSVGVQSNHYLLSYLGSIDSQQYIKEIDCPVYRGHQYDNKDYTPYFHINDSVSLMCARVDSISHRIYDSYSKELTLSGNMFLSVFSNLATNIEGGYGYWCGLAAIQRNIIIRDEFE